MSFTVGIFDFFSFTIPGFLYVFVINEICKVAGISSIDLFHIDDATTLILVAGLAFITGLLMNRIAKQWYKFWIRKPMDAEALEYLRKHYPDLNIEYRPGDWAIIFSALKQDHFEVSNQFEREEAMSQMLYSLSLSFFLLFFLEIFYSIYFHSPSYLFVSAIALAASISAMHSSRSFTFWFYRDVFRQGLLYGNSITALLSTVRKKNANEPDSKPKRKAS